jgi:hypothetical protein
MADVKLILQVGEKKVKVDEPAIYALKATNNPMESPLSVLGSEFSALVPGDSTNIFIGMMKTGFVDAWPSSKKNLRLNNCSKSTAIRVP